ncbi:MAG: GNAT family N-acetyltransferase [Clostridium sp.]|nr:GNAT family N-acetyltransferase [Clostridium sp.]
MNHQGTKRLETERLILRRFVIEDADEMYRNWANDDEVTKYLTWPTHPNADVTRAVLESWTACYEQADYYNWGIVQKESGKLIGNISVVSQDKEKQSAELGWCMGKAWWGQGIMPEAAGAVVEYLFTEAGFQRITARHDQNNPKSGRVMQKIGMQYEETRKAGGRNNQGIADMVCYQLRNFVE